MRTARLFRWFLVVWMASSLAGAAPEDAVPIPIKSEAASTESARAAALFERAFQDMIDRSPEWQTWLGEKDGYDRWDDPTDAKAVEDLARRLGFLAELKREVNVDALDESTRLSARLFEYEAARQAAGFPFRHHRYVIDQTGGPLTGMPGMLISQHRIDSESDARAYLARLRGIEAVFSELERRLVAQAEKGVIPPRWVFPQVAEVGANVISGRPFSDASADSPLWSDFQKKVAALTGVDAATKEALVREARAALVESVQPAYARVLARWDTIGREATDDDGVWKLPDGLAYYNYQLAEWTTTQLTADEIHAMGLAEVARIHAEMAALTGKIGFSGDLPALFRHLRDDDRFYLPATPAGRQEYLDRATAVIDDMRPRLDTLFGLKPRADIVVRATEEYREKSAPKAFYQSPAPNGTRPGMYYVTLYNMREMPTHQLEAVAYHEGIPGHHMQIAIAQELLGLPRFRRFGGYGAYSEGWALYCELLPKEIGLYRDPYSDIGRLATELWRAVRLVVDTGIHARRWTRAQAIDYFTANSTLGLDETVREVERYIMWPGQATSYKVGMIRILELRELARRELGAGFDIREFHDVVLRDGSVPLEVLEEQVRRWIAQKRG